MSRILVVAGLMMVIIGALHLAAPQMMMAAPGIDLTSANHVHVIRAAYGGAYIGIGLLFLAGIIRPSLRQSSLLAVVVIFSGFAIGRLTSIALDGLPVPLYLAVLVFEIVCAAIAAIALSR